MEPGTILQGRYVIERLLAHGGMSAVYLARHQVLGHPVAIKRLALERLHTGEPHTAPDELQAALLREGRLLASLEHPSIVRVIDCFIEANGCYLVLTYIEGETIGDRLRRTDAPVALSQALEWARALCEAMSYLHTRTPPVLYRDLKPNNIMIDREGRLTLLDLGIARRDTPDEQTRTMLKGWGTPHYSAPEQLAGLGTEPRSDIYAYGATLYALFTGARPTESLKRLLHNEALPPPRSCAPTCLLDSTI